MARPRRCPILALDNGNESSDELRDVRIGHVALIAGQPAVPNSTLTLPCQKAKRVRTHVPLSSNYGRRRRPTCGAKRRRRCHRGAHQLGAFLRYNFGAIFSSETEIRAIFIEKRAELN